GVLGEGVICHVPATVIPPQAVGYPAPWGGLVARVARKDVMCDVGRPRPTLLVAAEIICLTGQGTHDWAC
ncbi:MAG: hypothetical protein AB1644_01505, partial [Candidatus Zixiibacteriota bacterium]